MPTFGIPLFFAWDRIHAALLLVGGADDPLYQPEEMVLGLQRLGKEVHCVRYLGEGHTPREWAIPNREDLSRRVITWFKEHLGVEHSDV